MEFQSSLALAHDGVGTFLSRVIIWSGVTGLTHDAVHVCSFPDGQSRTGLSRSYPRNSTFHTAQTQLSIAAQSNGEVLMAMVSVRTLLGCRVAPGPGGRMVLVVDGLADGCGHLSSHAGTSAIPHPPATENCLGPVPQLFPVRYVVDQPP